MRIHYLEKFNNDRASSRYRAIIPAGELKRLGHEVSDDSKKHADWVIVIKGLDTSRYQLGWTGYRKMCFDLCDNHFITQYRDKHIKLCDMADLITCSTKAMKEEIWEHTGFHAKVISDPYEYKMIEPAKDFNFKDPVLFWHGNNMSVPPLLGISDIYLVLGLGLGYERIYHDGDFWAPKIKIKNNEYDFIAVGADQYSWSIQFAHEATLDGLSNCDVCIIPTQQDDWYKCKSPNRLINPVVRGRFVIANEMPAYEPFREWMWIGDIAEGLEWFKQQTQEEICRRITEAQKYIVKHHSPETIGKQWEQALLS